MSPPPWLGKPPADEADRQGTCRGPVLASLRVKAITVPTTPALLSGVSYSPRQWRKGASQEVEDMEGPRNRSAPLPHLNQMKGWA